MKAKKLERCTLDKFPMKASCRSGASSPATPSRSPITPDADVVSAPPNVDIGQWFRDLPLLPPPPPYTPTTASFLWQPHVHHQHQQQQQQQLIKHEPL